MYFIKSLVVIYLVTILGDFKQVYCSKVNGTTNPVRVALPLSERSGRQNSVGVDKTLDSQSSYSISPSFSYQFHTNDHEHLNPIVQAHHVDTVSNSFNSGGSSQFTSAIQDREPSSSAKVEKIAYRRNDATASPISPSFNFYYPQSEFPIYQQQQKHQISDAQRTRDLEGKQEKQRQEQSAPEAFSEQKYMSQKRVQVGDLWNKESTFRSQGNYTASPVQSEQQRRRVFQQNSGQSWSPLTQNEESRSHNSTSFVYSRPLRNNQNSNGKPATFKRQPVSQGIDTRYSPMNAQTKIASSPSTRSIPTREQAMQRDERPNARNILQSRADTYEKDEEETEEGDHNLHYHHEHDDKEADEAHDHDHDHSDDNPEHDYYAQLNSLYGAPQNSPEVRDFGLPGGFGGPFGGGPDPLGPLPPPPPPLKGSVDYILIPLILIGLAGPIFVVLYVILGAFEARISPIARSLDSPEYKPYIDTITSSVGRALEKYECFDYAVCRFNGFSSKYGFSESMGSTIESAVRSATPKEYLPRIDSLVTMIKNTDKDCYKYQCSSVLNKLSL